ncbi:serine hydrolase domain-containing protein [Streptomyces scabiei]|uniref:serine hydrolase domain-containing protein n=1 Tax=Streptomyces scabiei TaxID=1930 RepID=UPI001B33AB20|nr:MULTISPECIES: serine hydrolase domain-containing protein [Streptomyces]MDX2689844.1 serine hydrolase [Streptomyces scabiei]MDX2752118.1 serine hydrolase [Streptomyces scabiei]MDX2806705.1 serine hydrolase [Streptomyces scabiei]MDX3123164.1 serine hydrolase [Streptomyces scabiei]MDX3202086.1 serine hydrolase [Streptomyces scabiei]
MQARTARGARTVLVAATAVAAAVALAAPAVAAPAPAGTDHTATRKAMDAAVVKDGVPGVALQAKDKRGVWKATSGVGDTRTGKPRSAHDRYRVGSITKTFVSTVLLQLEAEGRLSLDDKVDTWLPGLVRGNGHDGRAVTLRQLLNHTSGIYDYTSDEEFGRTYFLKDGFFRHRYDTIPPKRLVAVAMKHKPDFAPGTDWSYSNTNYVLAGMVIGKVTGNPYGDEVRARVIEPLGLRSTLVPGTYPKVPGPSSRAYGKLARTATGPTYDVTELNPSLASAAGEMISDSGDLNRFYSALLKGRLLPPKQLAEMKTTIKVDEIPGAGYGLGLIERRLSCGITVWGHGGGIHGSTSEAVTTSDGRHSLALNLNSDWTGDPEAIVEAEFCGK